MGCALLWVFFSGGFYQDSIAQFKIFPYGNGCLECPTGSFVSSDEAPGKAESDCSVCPQGKKPCLLSILWLYACHDIYSPLYNAKKRQDRSTGSPLEIKAITSKKTFFRFRYWPYKEVWAPGLSLPDQSLSTWSFWPLPAMHQGIHMS